MNIESILAPHGAATITDAGISTSQSPVGTKFGEWFANQLADTNTQLTNADNLLRKVAVGEVENLHEVMIGLEKAKLSLQLIMAVRTHMLEAYQEVMRMQV